MRAARCSESRISHTRRVNRRRTRRGISDCRWRPLPVLQPLLQRCSRFALLQGERRGEWAACQLAGVARLDGAGSGIHARYHCAADRLPAVRCARQLRRRRGALCRWRADSREQLRVDRQRPDQSGHRPLPEPRRHQLHGTHGPVQLPGRRQAAEGGPGRHGAVLRGGHAADRQLRVADGAAL